MTYLIQIGLEIWTSRSRFFYCLWSSKVLLWCFSRNSHLFSVIEWISSIHDFTKISPESCKVCYIRFLSRTVPWISCRSLTMETPVLYHDGPCRICDWNGTVGEILIPVLRTFLIRIVKYMYHTQLIRHQQCMNSTTEVVVKNTLKYNSRL
jgi:hypothetical protein